jgi:tripartite-type tricarboxylate transporter receptor subunit TctC
MIVPYPAGGPTDSIARIMAEGMRGPLGQPMILDNVGGASGSIGIGRAARAAPNGYTLSIGSLPTHVLNGVAYSLKYDLLNDFEPVALLPTQPMLIVAKKAMQANDLKELIAWLKANPDRATQGTTGSGAVSHAAGVFFQKETGTRFQFVPYRGSSMSDLVGGQIDLMIDMVSNALPQVRAGTIKAYAVTSNRRLETAPDIPTVDEAGLSGLHISVWHGFWVPKGTPASMIATLNAAVVAALADPAVRKRFTDLGQDIPSREQQTPEALRAHHKAEIEKWWPMLKAANIKAQ